jgi:uncharacterized DUF497 family protein
MAITFDPAKRDRTLAERGLDFSDAGQVLDGAVWEFVDDRRDYGEERITTVGLLNERMVVVVWTERGNDRHIISMRKANTRERERYGKHLG